MNIISRIILKSNIMNAKQYFNVEIIRGIPLPKLAKNWNNKVQVGKDQEKAQSEKDSHSKNRGGKKPN